MLTNNNRFFVCLLVLLFLLSLITYEYHSTVERVTLQNGTEAALFVTGRENTSTVYIAMPSAATTLVELPGSRDSIVKPVRGASD